MCPLAEREARAFDNMCKAVDQFEIFERVTIANHKSFLPHAAVYKQTTDILTIGDVWSADLTPLEMQNASTKATATDCAPRRHAISSSGQSRARSGGSQAGNVIATKGYSTSQAVKTLATLVATQKLQLGDGVDGVLLAPTRRHERLMGQGRTTYKRVGVKLEKVGADYDPRSDTCLKAFVRLMAQLALDSAGGAE